MEHNIKSGETLTFYQLIRRYKILIPIIQRDYAQGREKEKEIRENFLNALYVYLDEEIPYRDLDFIYGYLRNNDSEFIPLDGQQRLTTLFLLHWYLYNISDNNKLKEAFKKAIQDNNKSRFIYETRISSTDFFNEIVKFQFDLKELENNSLSSIIKNCSWYHLSWNYDSTIQGVLVMLDSIHKKFKDSKHFFELLLQDENPIITFKFLNLMDFHLSDDLYIRMNSRGRLLTNFENFKAQFEGYLSKIKCKKQLDGKEIEVSKYFSYKIDTEWADFFWKFRNTQNNLFDDELMNFFRVVLTHHYIENEEFYDIYVNYNILNLLLQSFQDISLYKYQEVEILPAEINDKDEIIKDRINYLIDALDIITKSNIEQLDNDYAFYFDEKNTFIDEVIKNNFKSYHKRLMFYAYLSFLMKTKLNFDKNKLSQWIRVVHNLSHGDNSRIESVFEYARAIKMLKDILDKLLNNDILEYLKNENNKITEFSSWQITEERIKAHLISRNERWKKLVEETEQHRYFNGQIGFILEFSGIWEYYSKNRNLNWGKELDDDYYEKFRNYATIAKIIFDESYENRKNNENYIFERAVLVKGDYLTEASSFRKNLLSSNVVWYHIKRDHSWKRLLRVEDNIQMKNKRLFVKEVFDDIISFSKENSLDISKVENVKKALENIINKRKDKLEDWRDYFINNAELISFCKYGFIRFESKDNIRLYCASQSNQYHAELYTSYFFIKYLSTSEKFINNEYDEHDQFIYNKVRSIEDYPGIKILYNNKVENNNEKYLYLIFKNKNFVIDFKLSRLGDEDVKFISSILKDCGFEEFENGFMLGTDYKKLYDTIKSLIKRINSNKINIK
ncbi:MAG: DUF262 domain-containing protein [Bacteroidales bacterium]|nr:DUF262 domain-containing protein [Bacteroidales bacterium]